MQAIQYTGTNAEEIKELFKHLELAVVGANYADAPTIHTGIGNIYVNDWAIINDAGKYEVLTAEEYNAKYS